MKQGDISNM